MTFQLVGELVKTDYRTSRSGNEYVMFHILSPEGKEFEIVGFSKVAEVLKGATEGNLVLVNGHIDSEAKQTSTGGKFLNLKLIGNEVFILRQKVINEVHNTLPPVNVDKDNIIPF